MVPHIHSRQNPKTRKNFTARVGSSPSKVTPMPTAKKPLRKTAQRVADPAGKIREGAVAPSLATPPAHLFTSQNPLEEKTVTVKEAAYRLGKSTDAVYQWLRTGRLRGRQPGGRCCAILVLESSLNEALLCSFERASAGRSRPGAMPL